MTLRLAIILLTILTGTGSTWSQKNVQGIPFIRNYLAKEYKAHNQNFDIITGSDGTTYVANFEGLLYYDKASWRIMHTTGITRITAVFRDSRGTIWTGGYNYFGFVEANELGVLTLHPLGDKRKLNGEVRSIWEKNGHIYFLVSDDKIYTVINNHVMWATGESVPQPRYTYSGEKADRVTQVQNLDEGYKALVLNGEGLAIVNYHNQIMLHITEENGLCSNNINHITYDGHGMIWGATDNGVFSIAFPSIYSHFTPNEGLHGAVLSIGEINHEYFVGTQNGLYKLQGKSFLPVNGVNHACWQLVACQGNLLAATSNGVFQIRPNATAIQLTTAATLSLLAEEDGFLSGEMEGIYYNGFNQERKKISDIERVTSIKLDSKGTLWIQNLYGKIWTAEKGYFFTTYNNSNDEEICTLVDDHGKVFTVSANATKPFRFPLYSFSDKENILWLTDNNGRNLYAMRNYKREALWSHLVYPLMDYSVRAIWHDKQQLLMGGDKGINIINKSHKDPNLSHKPTLYIRNVVLNNDSIVYGGYGESVNSLELASDQRHISFYFAIDYESLLLPTQYRCRIDGEHWTAWDKEAYEEYPNLNYGQHTFQVQARDAFGRVTNIATMNIMIVPPFYMRWYMMVFYLLLIILLIGGIIKLRLYRLEREKHRLEALVQERTSEVVRLEKMATVGKLTQGLIDRILNPLNYINNFAKLSEGLVKDVAANIEDEKEHISEDNYEDTMDVLDMLKGNLEKVGEHGANTSRTLKAMEEMLKERSGNTVQINLNTLLSQDMERLNKFYAKDIEQHHIKTALNLPSQEVNILANIEQLSKAIMSMLTNAIYAVIKRAQRESYEPLVTLKLEKEPGMAKITIYDNGIGIEATIIGKVFDPFFTTKTTGEASGVGLYLSREIVQDLGGDIKVRSEKNNFTEFTITIPM